MSSLVARRLTSTAALFLCVSQPVAAQTVPTFDPSQPRSSFQAMAEYLAADGGQWRAPNPNHDPARPNSPPAFGLWFDWVAQQRKLELRIVVHAADSTFLSSSGDFVWHPAEQRISYRMVGRNGSLTEGTTDFTDASTFRTVATFHRPNGRSTVHRDENLLVSPSVHRNETFQQDSTGAWVSGGVYEWTRTAPSGFDVAGARQGLTIERTFVFRDPEGNRLQVFEPPFGVSEASSNAHCKHVLSSACAQLTASTQSYVNDAPMITNP